MFPLKSRSGEKAVTISNDCMTQWREELGCQFEIQEDLCKSVTISGDDG